MPRMLCLMAIMGKDLRHISMYTYMYIYIFV